MPYSTKDLCWLAGLLEGEGYFGNSKQNMIVAIDMTDLDVMQRVASVTGGKLWGPYDNGPVGRKPKWRVQLAGVKAAGWMMTLYGLLGVRRRARIRELLATWKTRRSGAKGKSHCLNGHPLSGDNLHINRSNKRVCRTCRREWTAAWRARLPQPNQVVKQIA